VERLTLETLLLYIGANVRRNRQRHGITQEALAEPAGFELRHIQEIESGRKKMSIEALLAIANALEVSPATLLRPATMPEVKRGRPRKSPK
jgi:transcriptional regulator with XRE-family HTH domain